MLRGALRVGVALAALLGMASGARAQGCDRVCMSRVLDVFLAGLYRHDPGHAGLARHYRGTENTVVVAPGEGLWRTVSGPGTVQRRYIDTQSQQLAMLGTLVEGGTTDIVSLRLKIARGRVSEAEWTIAREGNGLFSLSGLVANPPPDAIVPAGERTARAVMVDVSDRYFTAAQTPAPTELPHVAGCDRVENGVKVTNRAGPPLPPPPGGATNVPGAAMEVHSGDCTSGLGRYAGKNIRSADFRRYPVVDVEHGVVLAETMFHRPPTSSLRRNLLNEYFWFRGGRISGIFAAMHYLAPGDPDTTGWN